MAVHTELVSVLFPAVISNSLLNNYIQFQPFILQGRYLECFVQ